MSSRRKVANPLALAVLACLFERPMHPYEMASTMRERHKDESIKLNYGTLYAVVESLQRHRLIEPQETAREGHRPERTIYRLTDAGRLELIDWLSDLICNPVREYTQFEAGLSLLPVLPPTDVARLLEQRCERIEIELAQARAVREMVVDRKLPRLFWIEAEYRWRLREAELAWVRALAAEITAGTLEGWPNGGVGMTKGARRWFQSPRQANATLVERDRGSTSRAVPGERVCPGPDRGVGS